MRLGQPVLPPINVRLSRQLNWGKQKCAELLGREVIASSRNNLVFCYEARLERAFDRTLSQFERLQRLRLGQPVGRLNVGISG